VATTRRDARHAGLRGPYGIRLRLLVVNSVIVVTAMTTTILVAAVVGPPMFRRLMRPDVPRLPGDPYEHAFRDATAWSVGIALVVSALSALTLSWYLSRRVHRSATELAHAATAVANGRYDIRVSPPHLGKEVDAIADAYNMMAERLSTVESTRRQLLADLAHEIRTPVSVLEAYMEALEDDVQSLDHEAISMLREQTRRLVRLTVDVNALTTADQGRSSIAARWVCPQTLISTAVAAFANRYQAKAVVLTSHVPNDLPKIWADPERLGQVLGNLLDNALRHCRPHGHVDVAATLADDTLTLTVSDTGDGVAAEHLPYLFERFYRVDAARDRAHGGAGIGLSIAKALVEAHQGQIAVHSDGPGTGTAFTIRLPAMSGHRDLNSRPTDSRPTVRGDCQ
jgi:two-component system, OmpR family, sensor histidine kinase BaeS